MRTALREALKFVLAATLAAALPSAYAWGGSAWLAARAAAVSSQSDGDLGELVSLLQAADEVAAAWAPPERALPPPSKRARTLRKLGRRLGADLDAALLKNPCLEEVGPVCVATALDPFFEALDLQHTEAAAHPARVSIFGNSLIAGDRIIDVLRDELQRGFGDGGRGLLLVDRMASYGERDRTSTDADAWEPHTLADVVPSPHPFGISGVHHVSTARSARARFALAGERRGTLWWIDAWPKARLQLRAGGELVARARPRGTGARRALSFELPEGADTLEVKAEGGGAVVLGLSLELEGPGVVVDGLGVPSADGTLLLGLDEAVLRAQLSDRPPALVAFMLGGNEVKRLEWGRSQEDQVERDLEALVARVRDAAPGAACLLVSPIDAVVGGDGADRLDQRPFLPAVVRMQAGVAERQGCAFFDLHAAMGGAGSLLRFDAEGMMHEDLVHPRGRGLDLLGQLLTDALLTAWQQTPRAEPRRVAAAWATLSTDGLERGFLATTAAVDPERAMIFYRPELREALRELAWIEADGRATRRGRFGALALAVARGEVPAR